MTLNLIGLGMDLSSIAIGALEAIKSCDKVYLENYTVNFPYTVELLEDFLKSKITQLNRENVEDESMLTEARDSEIALLVYGDSLSATTHMQLIVAAKSKNIPYKIFHNSSIIIAVAETGLSLYKFGKTTSMPNWEEHTNKPTSFVNYVKENSSIGAHSLVLTDIGLELKDAIIQLKESCDKENFEIPEKIIVLSNAGTESSKFYYSSLDELKEKDIGMPFCIIVPSELSHSESEALEILKSG